MHLAQTLRQDSAAKSAALEEQKATLAAYVRDTKSKRSALEQRYVSLGEQFERLSDRYDTLLSESAQNSSRAEVAAAAADAKAAQERLRAQERGHARAIADLEAAHEAQLAEVRAAHTAELLVRSPSPRGRQSPPQQNGHGGNGGNGGRQLWEALDGDEASAGPAGLQVKLQAMAEHIAENNQ